MAYVPHPSDYQWMVIAGGIACGTMGIGIGANDVANNFGSSIGSGAIKFIWGVVIAAIFELVGAVGFGATVTDAVRKGVLNLDHGFFFENPVMLMWANFCALIAGTVWLLGCSAFGMPVSTTHTIVGTLLGVGLATGDSSIVNWTYVGTVVASWFISPVLCIILGMALFSTVRATILRKQNAIVRVGVALWLCNFLLVVVFSLFFILKSPGLSDWADEVGFGVAIGVSIGCGVVGTIVLTPFFNWLAHRKSGAESKVLPLSYRTTGFPCLLKGIEGADQALGLLDADDELPEVLSSSSSSQLSSQIAHLEEGERISKSSSESNSSEVESFHKNMEATSIEAKLMYSSSSSSIEEGSESNSVSAPSSNRKVLKAPNANRNDRARSNDEMDLLSDQQVDCEARIKKKWYSMPWFMDLNTQAMRDDAIAAAQSENSEKFAPRVERYFAALQILSAIVSCIVHGSNDVANAVAPFVSVYGMYTMDGYSETYETPTWILALGGGSIGIGVLFLGHKVIQSVGMKLIKMTPARGFCVELAMATVMVIGSMSGIPLSTTHCQVGATIGVGLIDKHKDMKKSKRNCNGFINTKAVNGKLIIKIFVAWIATLVVTAGLGAALYAFGAYSPYVPEL